MGSKTWFERAIFFSWYCGIRDCKFCYMSTQPDKDYDKLARRTTESILTEVLLVKKIGWDFGFFSGGMGAYKKEEFRELLENVYKVYGDKIWISVGPLKREEFIKGVVGSIETVNERLHDELCPSKPIEPYLEMFDKAKKLGLRNAMTIIVGLGETIDDFPKLNAMIDRFDISKIHFFALNPQKGTIFEGRAPPSAEYQAEWIRKTREAFPDIEIQCGIWLNKMDRLPLLLEAGTDSVSKFPALKYFGSRKGKEFEEQIEKAGFKMRSTMTKLPELDWDREVERLDIDEKLKQKVKVRLASYLKMLGRNKSRK